MLLDLERHKFDTLVTMQNGTWMIQILCFVNLGNLDLDATLTKNNDIKSTSLIIRKHFAFSGTQADEQTQAKVGMSICTP